MRDNLADCSVGLEQLREISPHVIVPQFGTTVRQIEWHGAMTTQQRHVLRRTEQVDGQSVERGWVVVSDFRETLVRLLDDAAAVQITETFTGTAPAVPAILAGRLDVQSTQLTWTGLLLVSEGVSGVSDQQMIDELHTLSAAGDDFGAAIDRLLAKLGYPRAADSAPTDHFVLTVSISEVDWQPRFTENDLQAENTGHLPPAVRAQLSNLRNRLFVRQGMLAFTGVMTRDEARAVCEGFSLAEADRRAAEELFARSVNSGLGQAKLQVRTLRGSAQVSVRDIDSLIPDA